MGNSSIFSLEQVYRRQLTKNWTDIFDPFIYIASINPEQVAGPAYGYFAGSYYPYRSDIDRIDYSNDTATASVKGKLPVEASYGGGTGNGDYGYTLGGWKQPGAGSYVFRQDYASDTTTSSTRGPLSVRGYYCRAIGNANYGYCGGRDDNQNQVNNYSIIDRVDYANDTATATATAPAGMVPASTSYGTVGNQSYGYFIGGYQQTGLYDIVSSVRRLDYANDTAGTSLKGPLTFKTQRSGGSSNANYGYITSGQYGSPSPLSVVHRIDFANDTPTAPARSTLSSSHDFQSGTGSGDYGYFSGGDPAYSYVDRIDYANDTAIASPKGPLSSPRKVPYTYSAQENGLPSQSFPRSVNPATETIVVASLGTDYGYNGGGYVPAAPNRLSLVDRIDYSNDTATAAVKGPLSVGRNSVSGISNVNYGYIAGGIRNNPTGDATLVDRIDYENDTATASPKGNLSATRRSGCPVGNNNYGYVAGGTVGGTNNSTSVDRIDYSSDTSTASVKGPLTVGDSFHQAGTGNQSSGYITSGTSNGDGYTQGSTIQKIDYSNDTATASPKGNLEHAMSRTAATGNSNFGYIGGGQQLGSRTYVQRIDYSNDSTTTSPKGALVLAKYVHSATSSTTHGYFSAGKSPAAPSTGWSNTDRIDYSNDTATAVDKSPLSAARAYHAGTSSRDYGNPTTLTKTVDKGSDGLQPISFGPAYGYLAGGVTISTVQRIDYASDTSTPTIAHGLHTEQSKGGGAGNITHGYTFGGDAYSAPSTITFRLDYSNDAVVPVSKGKLSAAGNYMSSVGNANFGYSGGRHNPTTGSLVDKLDYSNDTETAVALPVGMTPGATHGYSTTGNQSFGYFIGGKDPTNITGNRLSSVRRLDYSNDTAGTSLRGPLSSTTNYATATGNANFGYTISSPYGNAGSKIDRIEYANDIITAVTKGSLTSPGYLRSATGSADFGYFCGGIPHYTKVDRIDYSNDTATASAKGNLSVGTRQMQPFSAQQSGLFSQSYIPRVRFIDLALETPATAPTPAGPAMGYFAGGKSPSVPTVTQIQRVDYASDTATALIKGHLPTEHSNGGGTGSNSYGYTLGGEAPGNSSNVRRSDYANDTATASPKGPLSTAGSYLGSVGNINYGYTAGRGGPSPNYSIIDRVDYANDTLTASVPNPTGCYPGSASSYAAVGNQSYGYFVSGANPPSGMVTTVRRLDYSNDTAQTSPKGPINNSHYNMAGTGNANYGYVTSGGSGGSSTSRIDRIEYANDTATASPKGPTSSAGAYKAATGSGNFGYFSGGGFPVTSKVDRIDYGNDTSTASPKGNLDFTVRSHQAFSGREYGLPQTEVAGLPAIQAPFQPPFNFPVQNYDVPMTGYGYVAGGSGQSTVNRIDYANDTATASQTGNLPSVARLGGGAGNQSYGYTMGGYDGNSWGGASMVYRIDYGNDTATAATKGPLSAGRKYVDSIGNNSYGYTSGGYPSSTQTLIDRVTYANDTNTATSLGNIFSIGDRGTATAGNLNYGYFGGGSGYLPRQSTISRIDYANDSAATSPKGPLTNDISDGTAVGNANYGYWQIRYYPSTNTKLDRVDYSNDTATALPKGNLTAGGGYRQRATGNPYVGYFAGGYEWPSTFSTIQRINYNNDTVIASPKGPLTNYTYDAQSFSAHENGLSG